MEIHTSVRVYFVGIKEDGELPDIIAGPFFSDRAALNHLNSYCRGDYGYGVYQAEWPLIDLKIVPTI